MTNHHETNRESIRGVVIGGVFIMLMTGVAFVVGFATTDFS